MIDHADKIFRYGTLDQLDNQGGDPLEQLRDRTDPARLFGDFIPSRLIDHLVTAPDWLAVVIWATALILLGRAMFVTHQSHSTWRGIIHELLTRIALLAGICAVGTIGVHRLTLAAIRVESASELVPATETIDDLFDELKSIGWLIDYGLELIITAFLVLTGMLLICGLAFQAMIYTVIGLPSDPPQTPEMAGIDAEKLCEARDAHSDDSLGTLVWHRRQALSERDRLARTSDAEADQTELNSATRELTILNALVTERRNDLIDWHDAPSDEFAERLATLRARHDQLDERWGRWHTDLDLLTSYPAIHDVNTEEFAVRIIDADDDAKEAWADLKANPDDDDLIDEYEDCVDELAEALDDGEYRAKWLGRGPALDPTMKKIMDTAAHLLDVLRREDTDAGDRDRTAKKLHSLLTPVVGEQVSRAPELESTRRGELEA